MATAEKVNTTIPENMQVKCQNFMSKTNKSITGCSLLEFCKKVIRISCLMLQCASYLVIDATMRIMGKGFNI